MRAYMESGFYIIYLVFIIGLGLYAILKNKNSKSFVLFGVACIILGCGDAFHLIPRAVGLFSKTLDSPSETLAMWLGIGKLITSITMTIFYLLLYFFIHKRYDVKRNKILDCVVYILVLVRIVLCLLPQNGWITNSSPLVWGIIRNIPFVILGAITIVVSCVHLKNKKYYKLLWLAITLSFAFYLPVVILAGLYSWVGMLMLPKTICYMWIGFMGGLDSKSSLKS